MIEQDSIHDLLDRWTELRERGQEVSAEELCRDKPELVERLKEQIKASRSLQWLVETDVNAALDSTAGSLQTVSSDGGDLPVLAETQRAAFRLKRGQSDGSRFEILEPYAKGGLGEVFRARDGELNREVALKEIQARHAFHPDKQARFVREAQITGNLEHPGIVPVYGLGQYKDGRPYYAMRFIKGDTLRDAIDRYHALRENGQSEAGLELRKLLNRFIDVCNAIDYSHSRQVVHRDLKPANIMLGEYGETLVVDWGLAKLATRRQKHVSNPESSVYDQPANLDETQMGATVGTPAYMAPEQAAGDLGAVGICSDIYSLGATLYHLLVGKPPFTDRNTFQLLKKARNADYQPPRSVLSTIPKALEAICLKAMSVDPQDRYPTARALAADIEHWLADEPITVHQESLTEQVSRWTRRHRGATLAGALALLTIAVVSIVASLLVSHARHKESQAWEASARNRLFELKLLEGPSWDKASLSELRGLLTDIESLSPQDADVRRQRLFQTFSTDMNSFLAKPRFTESDDEAFSKTLDCFSKTFAKSQGLLAGLRRSRDERLSKWNELLDSESLFGTGFGSVFDPKTLQTQDGVIRRVADTASTGVLPNTIRTRLRCPAGNIELKAKFARSWTAASVIGLVLNLSDHHRYDFLLTVPQFDYRDTTADDLADLPSTASVLRSLFSNRLEMYILRDGQPLVSRSLPVPEGRLRLLARREGGRLSFTVNDANTIQFEDPFPLPSTDPGMFGLYLPEQVELETMQALQLRTAQKPSPVERGDVMFASAEFGEAEAAYRRIQNPECEYKRALCLLRLQRTHEAITILRQLFEQPPANGEKDTPWRLRAGCRLLQYNVEQKQWANVDHILDELANYYSSETIALMIPKSQIDQILQHRRREERAAGFVSGGRNMIEDLKWVVRVEELFAIDAERRRRTEYMLAHAFRWGGDDALALKTLDELQMSIASDQTVSNNERILYLWSSAYYLKVNDRADEGIRLIDQHLVDEHGAYRPDYLPLLVMRARCYWHKQNVAQAIADLEEFSRLIDKKTIHHGVYASACLTHGLILMEKGEEEAARRVFRDGLIRNWHSGYSEHESYHASYDHWNFHSFFINIALLAWTGELTEADAKRFWDMFVGSGAISTAIRRVTQAAISPAFMRQIIMQGATSPPARSEVKICWQHNMHSKPMMRVVVHPMIVAVEMACLRDLRLEERNRREINEFLLTQIHKVVENYSAAFYNQKDILCFFDLWRGKFNVKEFDRFINKHHDRQLGMALALILGHKFALDGNSKVARHILDMGLNNKNAHPILVRELKRKLDGIP